MTAVMNINDGYGLTALIIICAVIVIAMILGYRAVRGEPKTHRTRLGVFVERDKFEDEPAGVEPDTRELDPGDY